MPRSSSADRLVGVDVARSLALIGMMAVHILPGVVDGRVPFAQQAAGGRASALFALLAGVSLVFIAGTQAPLRGRPWQAFAAGMLVRAALVGLVGLMLGELGSGIAVILVWYALLFVLVLPFLALSTPVLAVVAAGWALLAPPLSFLLRSGLPPPSYDVPSFASLGAPVQLGRELLLTGYYPAATWLPYLLVGVVVGRLDLRSPRVAGALATVGGAAVALALAVPALLLRGSGVRSELTRTFEGAGWQGSLDVTLTHGLFGVVPTGSPWWLAVRAPHSGTTPDLLMTTGSALLLLALCLLVTRVLPEVWRVAFGAGAMTLTLYSLHVLLRADGLWDGDDMGTFVGQAVLVLVIGAAYAMRRTRGPLEAFVGVPSADVRRLVAR